MALDAVAILEKLVGFDTVSANSNLALIEWVVDYLEGYGVKSTLTRDADGAKANLFATIGPGDRGGVILSGHTDVVPVAGQAWDSDPFRLTERDGRSVWPRHRRYEGFYRTRSGLGAASGFAAAPKAAASGAQL